MKDVIVSKFWVAGLALAVWLGAASTGQGACSYSISPTLRTYGPGTTNDTVAVMAGTGCAWSTVNTNPWITILAGTNGTGTGVVRQKTNRTR